MTRSKTVILAGVLFVVACILILLACPGTARAAVFIEQVSLTYLGGSAGGNSDPEDLSLDGRYVLFYTMAPNVVPGDTNGVGDLFVRDRRLGTTERVSVSSGEVQGNGWSIGGAISADGRYAVFDSDATNLGGGGDTNGDYDVFVRDRLLGNTEQISVSSSEVKGNDRSRFCGISADGRYVAFYSEATNLVTGDTNGMEDVFLRDRQAGTTVRVSVRSDSTQGNGDSFGGTISADGRYVVFLSEATNLITGDTNGVTDVFVHDRNTGSITRVSVSSAEVAANGVSYAPDISSGGGYVVFESSATNLVAGDTNGVNDVFVRDVQLGTTARVSVSTGGAQAALACVDPEISDNGRWVAFESYSGNLVTGDTNGWRDIFVRDLQSGTTRRVSMASNGSQANGECGGPHISPNGSFVAFSSDATNLTAVDPLGFWQAYAVRNPGSVVYTSIKGVDRFDTALKISQAMFPGALPAGSGVVLTPGWESYQEALCGAPLAAAYGGPVLLSSKTVLYSGIRNELIRLDPDYVFCIGLTGTAVANAVQVALPGAVVTLINGTDVYHMSYLVAKQLGAKVGGGISSATAIATVGYNFPDAIGVSPLACYKKWPVLLTDSAGSPLHPRAVQAMTELGITKMVKAGTYAADPPGVTGLGNLSGLDRYHTVANVASWAKVYAGLTFEHTGLTTGDKFPDALAAGPYLAKDNGTLLLSPLEGPLPVIIANLLSANAIWVHEFSFIACIEPVIGQVKALLP